jgi:hypothetical protein
MVLADSHRISPVPCYSGYWLVDFFTCTGLSPSMVKFSKLVPLHSSIRMPVLQPSRHECREFGLFRVRSPLLAESLVFSLPPGTEMFQFPGFSFRLSRNHWSSTSEVSLFGHLRIKARLQLPAAYRSLPRPSSSSRAKAFPIRPYLLPNLKFLRTSSTLVS